MMGTALDTIGAHAEESVMVGDRIDADIIGGTESGIEPIQVLGGVTRREEIERFPDRLPQIVESAAKIEG